MSILKSHKQKENINTNNNNQQDKQIKTDSNIILQQRLLFKEILEFTLNQKLQPDQKQLLLKVYRRIQLFEKKQQWLGLCQLNQSFLNDFQFDTKFCVSNEQKVEQEFYKFNQIIKHFLVDFLQSKQQQLTVDNEFMENNLQTILQQVIADIQQLQTLKVNVKRMISTLEFYKQETSKETNILIQKLNDYIKMILLHEADCQQLSIENQEIMLNTFQQTFNQWYEKSKNRFTLKLEQIKEIAEQSKMEKKKLQLDLDELHFYEKQLSEDQDFLEINKQNLELRNQIFVLQSQLKKKGK